MKLIHHVVDIDAPTATVWAALTVAHGLASWWSTRLGTPEAEVGVQQHWSLLYWEPMQRSFQKGEVSA